MSHRIRSTGSTRHSAAEHALLFAALGDETRLRLLAKLAGAEPASISQLSISQLSISQLTAGSGMTRQAITKHLRVLEEAGIVLSSRAGRESLFQFQPKPMKEMQDYIERVSAQWDEALARLKAFVED